MSGLSTETPTGTGNTTTQQPPESTAYELLLKDDGLAGRLLSLHPAKTFWILAVLGNLPLPIAYVTGLLTMPIDGKGDFGYLATFNWSIMFGIVLPYVFALASLLNIQFAKILPRLSNPDVGIILRSDGGSAEAFATEFGSRVRSSGPWVVAISKLASLGVVIADSHDAVLRLLGEKPKSADLYMDRWMVASQIPELYEKTTGLGNLLLCICAYAVMGFFAFLGFYWVFKFWTMLNALAKTLTGEKFLPGYKIDLWIGDRENRLGLGGLGNIFTGFLRIVVIFLFYVAFRSIQVTAWQSEMSVPQYVSEVSTSMPHVVEELKRIAALKLADVPPSMKKKPEDFDDNEAYSSYEKDYRAESNAYRKAKFNRERDWQKISVLFAERKPNIGLTILLLCIFIPILVIVYFPMVVIKGHLDLLLDTERYQNFKNYKKAQEINDEAAMKLLSLRWENLKRAEVWPCGNKTAVRYLTFMVLLVIASFFPGPGIIICIAIATSAVLHRMVSMLPGSIKLS